MCGAVADDVQCKSWDSGWVGLDLLLAAVLVVMVVHACATSTPHDAPNSMRSSSTCPK